MNMNEQKALEWLTDVLSVQSRVLTIQDSRHSVAEWDSLGDLMLLARLEEDIGIIVSADEITAMNFIRDVCVLMEKNHVFSAG